MVNCTPAPRPAGPLGYLRADGRHAALWEAALSPGLAVALRLCSAKGLALYRGGAQAGGRGLRDHWTARVTLTQQRPGSQRRGTR